MSRLSQLAVSQRSVTLLLAIALFIAGISAWGSLKQELLPDIDFPVITVVAPYPGAGATDVAAQVSAPIERSIQSVARLTSLRSTSANSVALIVAQFSFGTNVKETRATIEQNLASLGLPAAVDPTVTALNINSSPVIIASIAATNPDGLDQAATIASTEIVPAIEALDGVANVDLTGTLEQQVVITLDPTKLAAAGVSGQQIMGVLQANNITIPSGQLPEDGTRVPVSTIGRLTSVDQIANLIVGVSQPQTAPGATPDPAAVPTPVRLNQVATVALERVATTGYARTNGQPSLTLIVSKASSGNTVSVARDVQQILDEAAARHPEQLTIETVQDLSTFILESQDGLLREGGLGALFAVLTIFLFLFSLRSTLVAAISIPLSVLTALVLMQFADVSLNIMTLGGLAVAVGRVVDDAIVVLENIYRHRALGRRPADGRDPGTARGGQGDHRQHADDGHGLPAHRLRRRPGQPALPALRADRHLRPARVARLRADGRTGARLPVHQPRHAQRRQGRRAAQLTLDSRLHADHRASSCAAAGRSGPCCSSRSCSSSGR